MYVLVVAGRGFVCFVCVQSHTQRIIHTQLTHTLFLSKQTTHTQDQIRRELLTAAAARDAPGEALYDVAKMYETGAYGAVPSPEKAVQFYEAVGAFVYEGLVCVSLGVCLYGCLSEFEGKRGVVVPFH